MITPGYQGSDQYWALYCHKLMAAFSLRSYWLQFGQFSLYLILSLPLFQFRRLVNEILIGPGKYGGLNLPPTPAFILSQKDTAFLLA